MSGIRNKSGNRSALGGFLDTLLQTFENCRHALTDETLGLGQDGCERFFTELYEKEHARLTESARQFEPHLTGATGEAFFKELDGLVRTVVIPAYVRHALAFTRRERNDFYLAEEKLHGLERAGWTFAGVAVGGFVVWAPFIPLWSKEWVVPFMLGGLFFPELRRYFANRRYEQRLNELVARSDREIARIDVAYLLQGEGAAPVTPVEKVDSARPAEPMKRRTH